MRMYSWKHWKLDSIGTKFSLGNMPRKVLLVCYKFPPNPGIGGRRWAKFAKYLAKAGVEVHVICKEWEEGSGMSNWAQDIKHKKIISHPVKDPRPRLTSGTSPLQKIKNQLVLRQWNKRSKGTPYDDSIYWSVPMLERARELIKKENIQHFIGTGAPFHMLYHALELKKEFPDLKLCADFRDPWTTGDVYGMKSISAQRLKEERRMEKEVIQGFDLLMSPYPMDVCLGDSFLAAKSSAHTLELTHAYDPDDLLRDKKVETYASKDQEMNTPSNPVHLMYGGSVDAGSEAYIKAFATWLTKQRNLQQGNTSTERAFQLSWFRPEHTGLKEIFKESEEYVNISPPIHKNELFKQLEESDGCIILLSDLKKDQRTTKFFEYLAMRKPLLLLGPKGDVSTFIEQHQLGIHFTEDKDEHLFLDLMSLKTNSIRQNKIDQHKDFHEQFAFDHVTDKLISSLDNL